jgi:hypothetical protein
MLSLPNEINDIIIDHNLTMIVKVGSLSRQYKNYFSHVRFWHIVRDMRENISNFINYVLNNETSYPLYHINYFFDIITNDTSLHVDAMMQGMLSMCDFVDGYRTRSRDTVIYIHTAIDNIFISLANKDMGKMYDMMDKFYVNLFTNYKCACLFSYQKIENQIFMNEHNFTHLFVKSGIYQNAMLESAICDCILITNKNIKTIISESTIGMSDLPNLDLLIVPGIRRVHNMHKTTENWIEKSKFTKLTLTSELCNLRLIPQSITILNIKNHLLWQNHIDIIAKLPNLNFISFNIALCINYVIPIKTNVINIILEPVPEMYVPIFSTITISHANICLLHDYDYDDVNIEELQFVSNSITELIFVSKIICNLAFLNIPKCNNITFPICDNTIVIDDPVLNKIKFYRDGISDRDIMAFECDISINSQCLQELDLSMFDGVGKLNVSPNVKVILPKKG